MSYIQDESTKVNEHITRLEMALSILIEYGVDPSPRQRALLNWYHERLDELHQAETRDLHDRFYQGWDKQKIVYEDDLDDPDDPRNLN